MVGRLPRGYAKAANFFQNRAPLPCAMHENDIRSRSLRLFVSAFNDRDSGQCGGGIQMPLLDRSRLSTFVLQGL